MSECYASLPTATGCLSEPTSMLCITNHWAVLCVRDLFHIGNPFLSSICPLSLLFPPLSGRLRGLSLFALALFCHTTWPWWTRLFLFHYHWLHFLCVHKFSHLSFPLPLSVCHIYIETLTLNSTPCCPPARLFSPCPSLLSSRPLPPSCISSLQGESQWDWETEAEQDDCLHHRTVRHGADMQRACSETRQTNHPKNGCVPYEDSERKWQY